MHVDTIRRRHGDRVYESFLVRRSVREGKRVRKETVANISGLPAEAIEAALARRELEPGGFVLYDLSSSYLEGSKCPLGAFGYSRDGKPGKLQISYGLTCSPRGRPVAIEVFGGEIHDEQTLPEAAERLKRRFGIERVCFVGDRGMVKQAGVETLAAHGFDWITALTAPQVKRLAREGDLQLSLFDETNLAELASADFPGEIGRASCRERV